MQTLKDDLNLALGDTVTASIQVVSVNYGTSDVSPTTSVDFIFTPLKPTGVENLDDVTSAERIGLEWQAGDSQGSDIIDYTVWMKNENDQDYVAIRDDVTETRLEIT